MGVPVRRTSRSMSVLKRRRQPVTPQWQWASSSLLRLHYRKTMVGLLLAGMITMGAILAHPVLDEVWPSQDERDPHWKKTMSSVDVLQEKSWHNGLALLDHVEQLDRLLKQKVHNGPMKADVTEQLSVVESLVAERAALMQLAKQHKVSTLYSPVYHHALISMLTKAQRAGISLPPTLSNELKPPFDRNTRSTPSSSSTKPSNT